MGAVKALASFLLLGLASAASCQIQSPPPTQSSEPPVVWVQHSPGWQAIDWAGKTHGVIGAKNFGPPFQSPDGSRVLVNPNGDWKIVDIHGRLVSRPDLTLARSIAWADDSSGLCVARAQHANTPDGAGPYDLDFVPALTGASKNISSFSTRMGPDIAACSPTSGRIVVVTATGYKDPRTEMRVSIFGDLTEFDFKTGRVGINQTYPIVQGPDTVSWIEVSRDGMHAALETATETRILDLSTGGVVSKMASAEPLAFSWDGARLAVVPRLTGEIVDVKTGAVMWTDAVAGRVTQWAIPQPRGQDLMLITTFGSGNDLIAVTPSGATRTVATNAFMAQVGECTSCSTA